MPPSLRLIRSEIVRHWQLLNSRDLEDYAQDRMKLVELLQTRYGYARSRAEKEVDLFFSEFEDRLRRAA